MAKLNLSFNGKNYELDESSISAAVAELKSHLSTTMAGSGATINFGGTNYSIDSTKLSAATNDFITHLGTIAGNGSKVTVNGTEYSIDSSKLSGAITALEGTFSGLSGGSTPVEPSDERLEGDGAEYYTLAPTALSFRSTEPLAEFQEVKVNGETVDPSNYTLEEGSTIVKLSIDYLKTLDVGNYEVAVASEGKTVKGDFNVKAPELNEHGFYYNQPYTAYVSMIGTKVSFYAADSETLVVFYHENNVFETCSYEVSNKIIVMSPPSVGTLRFTFSEDGMSAYNEEIQSTFVIGDKSIAADENYIYFHRKDYYFDGDLDGYEVWAIDLTKTEYIPIKTGINDIPTRGLAETAFADNKNLVIAPEIPDTVTIIGAATFRNCENLTSITIPNSVTSIGNYAFEGCSSLESVVIPDSVTSIGVQAFLGCTNLTSITFNGTIAQWNSITKDTNWNYNVPAIHVRCIDGDVAL